MSIEFLFYNDKFQTSSKQIRFPKIMLLKMEDGSIETVKLFKSKRQWFFVFSFPSVLSYESFVFLIVFFTLLLIL